MIWSDFLKAFNQLLDPRFTGVLLRAVGLTLALLAVFFAAFTWGLGWLVPDTIRVPFIGEVTLISSLLSLAAILAMLGLSVFLMVPVASVFVGFFLDDVVDAVEAVHYGDRGLVDRLPMSDVLVDSLRFLGVVVAANLLALVVYLMLPPFAPLVFWALNGFLLGREYFHLVASRRIGREGADRMRRAHLPEIWMAGFLMAVPLSVPLVNLLVPVLGVATFTHMFHRLNRG
jgi:uncharacterized protein involved in cysteine biosynthesis